MTSPYLLTDEERAALLDASAKLLALVIEPEWRADVLFHMNVIAEAAQLVSNFPLDDALEPAPVFVP